MVAYSFHPMFSEPVATLVKRQTVRGNRKRHARPGELIQLYTGMRTRQCRKLLTPDPVCLDVRHIEIVIDAGWPFLLSSIAIEGVPLSLGEMEAFAWDDGFRASSDGEAALFQMGQFWLSKHGVGTFEGVVIRWEPASA